MSAAEKVDELRVLLRRANELLAEIDLAAVSNPAPPVLYMSIDEYAHRRGVSRETVKRWKTRGLPCHNLGRIVRVRVAEADQWLENNGGR